MKERLTAEAARRIADEVLAQKGDDPVVDELIDLAVGRISLEIMEGKHFIVGPWVGLSVPAKKEQYEAAYAELRRLGYTVTDMTGDVSGRSWKRVSW